MKLSTSLIAVKKINSPVDRSTFSEKDLNSAAASILKAEGLINPLVVKRLSLDAYEVVNGHLEYYAAVRAREIDPRKGETIGAFIIDSDNEAALIEQVEILRNNAHTQLIISPPPETIKVPTDSSQVTPEKKLDDLTTKVEQLGQASDRMELTTKNKLDNLTTKVEQLGQASDRMELTTKNKLDNLTTKVEQLGQASRMEVTTENKLDNLTTKVEQLFQAIDRIESVLSQPAKPKATSTTQPKRSYNKQPKLQLQEELDRRKIKVTPKGKKVTNADMIAALEADDEAKKTSS